MADLRMPLSAGTRTFVLSSVDRSAPPHDVVDARIDHQLRLITSVLAAHGGALSGAPQRRGDVLGVFTSAVDGVAAALAAQRECALAGFGSRVKLGVHTAEISGANDAERAAHYCTKLRDVAHGGQTLLSSATRSLVVDALPGGAWLVDLGVLELRGMSRQDQLFELRHADLVADVRSPSWLAGPANNLPTYLTSFVGRGRELVEARKVLDDQRLVTLAGAGGCGKTRLAVEVVADLADRWPDGVWWVDLGAIADPVRVVRAVAAAVGALVEPVGDPLQALVAQMRGRRLLVCLDTCEHLLDPCAELVDTVLRGCPGVSVLATSREPLGLSGEVVWRVPPLEADEAASLFVERAALVRTGFTGDDERAAVQAICGHLDGIPLAIELAASWVRALPPAEIAAHLDDRFRFLVGGPRVAADRHRTLVASITWSYDLLDDADRILFRRLAVFAGGFTVDSAGAVGPDVPADGVAVLEAIGRLVDKSLVVVDEVDGGVRYRMLDTIREFAEDRLRAAQEEVATRDRHLDHFLIFAEAAEPELERDLDRWRQALEREHDNLRAALVWGLASSDPVRGRRLAAALARFWYVHGHTQEALGFLNRAVQAAADDRTSLQASLLAGLGQVAMGGGLPEMAADAANRGLQIAVACDDVRSRGRCRMVAAYELFFTDFAASHQLARQAEQDGLKAADPVARDWGGVLRACALTNRDRHDEAAMAAREVLGRIEERGERSCAAIARSVEVWASLFTGDLRRAGELGREALHLAEPLGDYFILGHTTYNLAWVTGLAGATDAGLELMDPIIRAVTDAGPEVELLPWFAAMPGKLHLWRGDLEDAVRWLEIAGRFAEPNTDNWVVARTLPGLATALRRLGRPDEARARAERALALATALDVPHVRAEALDELAHLATDEQDLARAHGLHRDALAVRMTQGLRTFVVDSLDALAGLAARAGNSTEAARVLAASDSARAVIGYPRPAIAQPEHDAVLATLHSGLGDDSFAEAWAQGSALSLDEALVYTTRSRGARQRPATGWASLTPAEREVVELVVAGRTNPEIGERLFMSRSTVKTHLAHVYAKLGVANRTELATLVGKRGTE